MSGFQAPGSRFYFNLNKPSERPAVAPTVGATGSEFAIGLCKASEVPSENIKINHVSLKCQTFLP